VGDEEDALAVLRDPAVIAIVKDNRKVVAGVQDLTRDLIDERTSTGPGPRNRFPGEYRRANHTEGSKGVEQTLDPLVFGVESAIVVPAARSVSGCRPWGAWRIGVEELDAGRTILVQGPRFGVLEYFEPIVVMLGGCDAVIGAL